MKNLSYRSKRPKYQVLVLGLGNLLRSDDGIGVSVVRRIQEFKSWPGTVLIEEVGTAIIDYLVQISKARFVIIVDAIHGDGEPGTIYRFTECEISNGSQAPSDTHSLLPVDIIHWARALTGWPYKVLYYGIEPESLDLNYNLSPIVKASIPGLVLSVTQEIQNLIRLPY